METAIRNFLVLKISFVKLLPLCKVDFFMLVLVHLMVYFFFKKEVKYIYNEGFKILEIWD